MVTIAAIPVNGYPNYGPIYLIWGFALISTNDVKSALPLVRKGMALSPEGDARQVPKAMQNAPVFIFGLVALAGAALKEGNVVEAREYLERVRKSPFGAAPLLRPQLEKAIKLTTLLLELKDNPNKKLEGDLAKLSAEEWVEFANESMSCKFLAAAVRFFDEGFSKDPALARQLFKSTSRLYGGFPTNGLARALAAIFVGIGRGHGSAKFTEVERARYRQVALNGFRAELAVLDKRLREGPKRADREIDEAVRFWEGFADEWRRDSNPLNVFPEAERPAWQQFRAEVEALLKRVKSSRP
jgi:tetratricopeptide (TPR) repeat protein